MISIIIPVHNVEDYLFNCLKSISSQTFEDFEVFLVDDGSTDRSGNICDEYCRIDCRFKVYHKQNGGVSSARNYALDKISGEWVYFCDADDVLYDDTLKILLENIDDNIVCSMGGYVKVNNKIEILERNEIIEKTRLSIEETLVDFYSSKYSMFNGFLWNRLFRNDIIKKNNLKFREDIYIKEDGLFIVQYLCHCKGEILYNSQPIYKYVIHSSSVMHTKFKSINTISLSRLAATIECYKEIKKTNYIRVLPFAKKQIFLIRRMLLEINDTKIVTNIINRIKIDVMISQALGITPLFKVYFKRITNIGGNN